MSYSNGKIIEEIKNFMGETTYCKYENGFEEWKEYINGLVIRYYNSKGDYMELDEYGNTINFIIPK